MLLVQGVDDVYDLRDEQIQWYRGALISDENCVELTVQLWFEREELKEEKKLRSIV